MIKTIKCYQYRILISVLVVLLSNIAYSQSKSFQNILKIKTVNSGVMLQGSEVRGYYFFYKMDKAKGGKRNYLLSILDQNLNEVKTSIIEESKNTELVEAKFNGKYIMFKLLDFKTGNSTLLTYDVNGELVDKNEKEKLNFMDILLAYGEEDNIRCTNYLSDVTDVGFINQLMTENGRGYTLTMYPTDKAKADPWIYNSDKKKGYERGTILTVTNGVVYILSIKMKTMSSFVMDLIGIDVKTGNKLFEVPLNGQYSVLPGFAYYDHVNDVVNLIGVYSNPEESIIMDNGLGLFKLSVDKSGNFSNQKYLSWTNMAKFGDFSRKSSKHILFHNIVQNKDGSILVVGEQFRQEKKEMIIEDLAIFNFTPDFEIQTIEFVEKPKTTISITDGGNNFDVFYNAQIEKLIGNFDYLYTQNSEKDNSTTICYREYENDANDKLIWNFGAATLNDGQITKDKIDLNTETEDKILIHKAKPGYILVEEYNEKEKRVDIHLERINY